ncbi:hypothetical protein MSG28_004791 [Choristoneura fumiferana]|uniref:Uncharacterized protein n=1 Tax=Choristoneura fumiferana TaxID=7141 RepID=A0ACC0K7M1_CHOFU|nr:hypothetical protein MSG28_004791 [Choristoneura fumiferana]
MRTRLNFSMCRVVVKIMDRGARSKFILGLVNKNYGIGKIGLPNLVRNTSKDQEGKPIKWLKIKCLRFEKVLLSSAIHTTALTPNSTYFRKKGDSAT